jgi:hypothetical protein
MRKTRAEFHTPGLNPRHRSHKGRRTRVEFHTPHLDPRHQDFGIVPSKTDVRNLSPKVFFIGLTAGILSGALLGFFIIRFFV